MKSFARMLAYYVLIMIIMLILYPDNINESTNKDIIKMLHGLTFIIIITGTRIIWELEREK